MLRRGLTLVLGPADGRTADRAAVVKGTAYSLYPVAAIALLATLWRHHRRAEAARHGRRSRSPRWWCASSPRISAPCFTPRAPPRRGRAVEPGGTSRAAPSPKCSTTRSATGVPVGGVPAPALRSWRPISGLHAARVRDLRRTRMGGVRLVRRVVSEVGLLRDPRRDAARARYSAIVAARAGVELRAPQRARDGRCCC